MDLRAGLSSAGKASTSEKKMVWCSSELSVPAQAGMAGQVCLWVGSQVLSTAGGSSSVPLCS